MVFGGKAAVAWKKVKVPWSLSEFPPFHVTGWEQQVMWQTWRIRKRRTKYSQSNWRDQTTHEIWRMMADNIKKDLKRHILYVDTIQLAKNRFQWQNTLNRMQGMWKPTKRLATPEEGPWCIQSFTWEIRAKIKKITRLRRWNLVRNLGIYIQSPNTASQVTPVGNLKTKSVTSLTKVPKWPLFYI
jgi:hypothetical protein